MKAVRTDESITESDWKVILTLNWPDKTCRALDQIRKNGNRPTELFGIDKDVVNALFLHPRPPRFSRLPYRLFQTETKRPNRPCSTYYKVYRVR